MSVNATHSVPNGSKRRGRPPSPTRAALRQIMGTEWSERTFARFYWAYCTLVDIELAGVGGCYKRAIALCTRPGGSVNVSRLVRVAEIAQIEYELSTMDEAERVKQLDQLEQFESEVLA